MLRSMHVRRLTAWLIVPMCALLAVASGSLASAAGGQRSLFSIGVNGEGRTDLSVVDSALLSPDRSTIALVRGGTWWLMNSDGSRPRPLYSPASPETVDGFAAWS